MINRQYLNDFQIQEETHRRGVSSCFYLQRARMQMAKVRVAEYSSIFCEYRLSITANVT